MRSYSRELLLRATGPANMFRVWRSSPLSRPLQLFRVDFGAAKCLRKRSSRRTLGHCPSPAMFHRESSSFRQKSQSLSMRYVERTCEPLASCRWRGHVGALFNASLLRSLTRRLCPLWTSPWRERTERTTGTVPPAPWAHPSARSRGCTAAQRHSDTRADVLSRGLPRQGLGRQRDGVCRAPRRQRQEHAPPRLLARNQGAAGPAMPPFARDAPPFQRVVPTILGAVSGRRVIKPQAYPPPTWPCPHPFPHTHTSTAAHAHAPART